jgi:hypothetical protein
MKHQLLTNYSLGMTLWCYQPLIYEPLSKGEIRVLNLHPGNLCSSIRCTISHISLFQEHDRGGGIKKSYQALSYTWGRAKPTAAILCNGQILEVTKNLYEALLYLRHRGVRTIWIDAICIDQGNLDERAEQVQLMKRIYDEATSLVVWLGAGTKATDEGFRFIDYINQQFTDPYGRSAFDIDLFSTCSDASFAALSHLISRPWFYRAWIIQEVVSGKHKAMVYCGKAGRRWSHLTNAIGSLAQKGLIGSIQEEDGPTKVVLRQLELFENVESQKMDLMPLATMARAAQATDPRDKIYALFNLAKDADGLCVTTKKRRIPFRVDYTQPVRDIYIAAAKAMIISSGLQGVLSQIWSVRPSIYGLPSWVPDWSIPRKGSGIDWESWRLDTERFEDRWTQSADSSEGHQQKYFNASQNYGDPVFDGDETPKAEGVRFDTLKSLSSIYPGSSGNGADVIRWLRGCDTMAGKCFSDISTGRTEDALWRTLIADRANDKQPAPAELRQSFETCRRLVKLLSCFTGDEHAAEELVSLSKDAYPYMTEMGRRCNSRRFATTHGGYMGLVPGTAVVNDVVAIIDGCRVPFILHARPRGRFRLTGDCYVHGIMYGEAVTPSVRLLRSQRRVYGTHTPRQRRVFQIE